MDDVGWSIGAGLLCGACADKEEQRRNQLRNIEFAEYNRKLTVERLLRSGIPEPFWVWDEQKGNNELLDWIISNNSSSLFIGDDYGTCKTRAVCVAGKKLVFSGVHVRYWRSCDLSLHLAAACSRDLDEAESEISDMSGCDLLILDDFGKEKVTDRAAEMVFSIIDNRYLYKKMTWITSNLNGTELEARLGSDRGPAILRRLRETFIVWNPISKGNVA